MGRPAARQCFPISFVPGQLQAQHISSYTQPAAHSYLCSNKKNTHTLIIKRKNHTHTMKYFSIDELTHSRTAARLGIDNTPSPEAAAQLRLLVEHVLDPLRQAWGRPIAVTSGYRCPQLNKAVGGVPGSQHLLGQAADIVAGSPRDNARLYKLLQQLQLPVDQAIDEHGHQWLHVSHGPRNRRSYFSTSK